MNKVQLLKLQNDFSTAHHDYEKGLVAYASLKINDVAKVEDLVQETFAKTWTYLQREGKIDLMKAFLYHILNDLIVDDYRKKKTTSLDLLIEWGFDPSEGDPERLFDALDGKAAMGLIRRLPATYQKVMQMRYVQGLSLSETSLITGQTKNTIAVQIHRGLGRLKVLHESTSADA